MSKLLKDSVVFFPDEEGNDLSYQIEQERLNEKLRICDNICDDLNMSDDEREHAHDLIRNIPYRYLNGDGNKEMITAALCFYAQDGENLNSLSQYGLNERNYTRIITRLCDYLQERSNFRADEKIIGAYDIMEEFDIRGGDRIRVLYLVRNIDYDSLGLDILNEVITTAICYYIKSLTTLNPRLEDYKICKRQRLTYENYSIIMNKITRIMEDDNT